MAPPSQPKLSPALAKAMEYHRTGQFDRALKNYRRALKQSPSQTQALVLGGQAAFQAGHQAEAIRWLKKACEMRPEDAEAPYNLGVMYHAMGNIKHALQAFETAISADPDFALAHYNLAMALNELGHTEQSLEHFDHTIRLKPDHGDAHAAKAYVLRNLGRIGEAIGHYETAVGISPANAKAWVGLGTCLQESGRVDDGLVAHQNAMKADPDYPDAAMNACDAFVQMKKPEEGIAVCDAFLERHPGDSGVLATKSLALNEAGKTDAFSELVDLDRFVQPITCDAPPGFKTMSDFNAALNSHVLNHPTLIESPSSHTTMNGKQTGSINTGTKGPIAALEMLIERAIEQYMSGVAENVTHPVVAHRPAQHEVSIWATVLEGKGFQAPHIHPSGWLSGVYYPQVPGVVEEGGHDGWIEFGQPGPEYHFTAKSPHRLVKPQPGMMVMFPSYMFHRTVPFESSDTRISIAFDVIPV